MATPSQVEHSRNPVADAFDHRVMVATRGMFEAVVTLIDWQRVEDALRSGGSSAALHALDLYDAFSRAFHGAGIDVKENSLKEALQATYAAGAQATLQNLGRIQTRKGMEGGTEALPTAISGASWGEAIPPDLVDNSQGLHFHRDSVDKAVKPRKPIAVPTVGLSMSFNLNNPRAIDWIENYSFGLITSISDDTRLAIQTILSDAFTEGMSIPDQMREIRDIIGLTSQQAQALANFENNLKSQDPALLRQVLNRTLRDARHDPTIMSAINIGKPIPSALSDKMVERYQSRLLDYRAETIARTETIRASSQGQIETWVQAKEQGYLSNNARMEWIASEDACDDCLEIEDMNPDGVLLEGQFETPWGPLEGPPGHTNCRCGVGLVEV